METLLTIVFFLVGVAIGSFLNVCTDRLPAGKSLIHPPSHCEACQRRLAPADLIPVLSYLWLRGRCRYCQAPVPRRILWVELLSGAIFAFTYWHYGLSMELAVATLYCYLFLVIGIIDLEQGLILNKLVYPALPAMLIISIFLPPSRLIYSSSAVPPLISNILPHLGIVEAAIGGGIGLGIFLLIVLISRGGMGWGDVKLAVLIGLVTGFPLVFMSILLGAILGGVVAVILLLLKIKKRKETIPFGPFLSLAAMVTLLWGSHLASWYLGQF